MEVSASLEYLRKLDNINITEEEYRKLAQIEGDIIFNLRKSPQILKNNSILNEILSINILDKDNYIKNLAEKVIGIMIVNEIHFDQDTLAVLTEKFNDLAQKLVDHGANPIKAPEAPKLQVPQVEAAQAIEKTNVEKIVEAIFSNDAKGVSELLKKTKLIDYVDEKGVSFFHLAAAHFLANPTKKALEVFKPLLLQLKNNPGVLKVATSKDLGGLKWSDIYVSNIDREGNPDTRVASFFKYVDKAYLKNQESVVIKIPTKDAFTDLSKLKAVKESFIKDIEKEFDYPSYNLDSAITGIMNPEIYNLGELVQEWYEWK